MAELPLDSEVYCISTREATRLTYTSVTKMSCESASKNAAAIFQKLRGSGSVCAAAKPRHKLHMSWAACGARPRINGNTDWSNVLRVSALYTSGKADEGIGTSSQCHAYVQRSAG